MLLYVIIAKMNQKYIRRLAGFYEASGQFSVPEKDAVAIIDTATRIVGKYTGRILLTGIQGARISLPDNPLAAKRIRLGSELHKILLTKRGTRGNAANDNLRPADTFVAGTTVLSKNEADKITDSRILVSTIAAGTGTVVDEAIEVAVHEMGHSWGIEEHCAVGGCIMQTVCQDRPRDRFLSGNPFCDNCAGDLEIAGYMALSQQL